MALKSIFTFSSHSAHRKFLDGGSTNVWHAPRHSLTSGTVRGTFLINPKGIIQSINWYYLATGRSVEEMLRQREAIKLSYELALYKPVRRGSLARILSSRCRVRWQARKRGWKSAAHQIVLQDLHKSATSGKKKCKGVTIPPAARHAAKHSSASPFPILDCLARKLIAALSVLVSEAALNPLALPPRLSEEFTYSPC